MSGVSTESGPTTVNAGTMRADSATGFSPNSAYTVNGGTLDLNDHNLSIPSLSGTGGTVDLGTAALTVNQTGNTTYSGVITGTGGLAKSGAGNLTLAGASNYSGGTTVSAGTLTGTTTSLQGNVNNNAAVVVNQSTTGTYAGNMTGSGALTKSGTGNVTLSGTNSYVGGTTVSAGTITGTTTSLQGNINNNAAVIVDQSSDGTYAGSMTGTGTVVKSGAGVVTFSGNSSYSGSTTISAGTLEVDGTTTSDTTISAPAFLRGIGAISGNVSNSGTMAPGNGIGTFSVNGSYTSNAQATVEIQINGGGSTPGINVDLLVVSGTANLDGSVDVQAAAGTYLVGTQYTFLSASSIVGTFASITDDLAFLDAVLGYTAGSVYFTLISPGGYAGEGTTSNTFNVGTYLDEITPGATGDLQTLLDELNQVSEADANFALEQLTSAVYGSIAQIGVQNTSIYLQALSRRLRSNLYDGDGSLAAQSNDSSVVLVSSTRDEPLVIRGQCCRSQWNTWATGFGLGGDADSDGNAAALDYSMGGTLVGMEALSGTHLLGFYGGYLGNYIGTDANESAKVNGGTFGSYYVGRDDNQYYIVAGGFEFDGYESRRRNAFADDTAFGETDGWKGYSYLERGATFGNRRLAIQPFAGAQYVYLRQNGFTETGAAAANLDVPGINTHSLRSIVGARLYGAGYSRSGRSLTPEVRALWLHEFLDTSTGFETFFSQVGGGSAFSINGLGLGRDWALVGTGLNSELGAGWSAYADYDLIINDRTTFHIGSGGVPYRW